MKLLGIFENFRGKTYRSKLKHYNTILIIYGKKEMKLYSPTDFFDSNFKFSIQI